MTTDHRAGAARRAVPGLLDLETRFPTVFTAKNTASTLCRLGFPRRARPGNPPPVTPLSGSPLRPLPQPEREHLVIIQQKHEDRHGARLREDPHNFFPGSILLASPGGSR